jgi:flagellar protein FliJ
VKALKSMIRLHRGTLDERRRDLVTLESRRAQIEAAQSQLEVRLLAEQRVAAGNFEVHFSYPNFARAAIARRDAFAAERRKIDGEIAKAIAAVAEVFQDVKRYETALDNHQKRLHAEEERRHQAALDEVALTIHRRKETNRL